MAFRTLPRLDQPIVEQSHGPCRQRPWSADEPVAVGARHLDSEQPRQPFVVGPGKVIVLHDRNAQPLRGGLEDQLTRIVVPP